MSHEEVQSLISNILRRNEDPLQMSTGLFKLPSFSNALDLFPGTHRTIESPKADEAEQEALERLNKVMGHLFSSKSLSIESKTSTMTTKRQGIPRLFHKSLLSAAIEDIRWNLLCDGRCKPLPNQILAQATTKTQLYDKLRVKLANMYVNFARAHCQRDRAKCVGHERYNEPHIQKFIQEHLGEQKRLRTQGTTTPTITDSLTSKSINISPGLTRSPTRKSLDAPRQDKRTIPANDSLAKHNLGFQEATRPQHHPRPTRSASSTTTPPRRRQRVTQVEEW